VWLFVLFITTAVVLEQLLTLRKSSSPLSFDVLIQHQGSSTIGFCVWFYEVNGVECEYSLCICYESSFDIFMSKSVEKFRALLEGVFINKLTLLESLVVKPTKTFIKDCLVVY